MRYIFLAAIFILASIVVHAQPSVNEIVFFGGPGITNTGTQVYSIRADGSGQVNLTNNPAATHLSPNWSPDGTKIVLSINDFIWVMNADGTNRTQLTVGGAGSRDYPVWSPDGSRIAYVFDGNGFEPPSINVINADGGNQRQLTFISSDGGIDWSPDGSKIVFSSFDGNGENIYVMNADGTSQTAITNRADRNFHPKWSPR